MSSDGVLNQLIRHRVQSVWKKWKNEAGVLRGQNEGKIIQDAGKTSSDVRRSGCAELRGWTEFEDLTYWKYQGIYRREG